MHKYFARHLQIKLVAVVMLGIIVAFSVIGWLRIRDEKLDRLEDLHDSGHERVVLLASASANLLIGYDYSNMEALAERVLGQRDVKQVVIRNAAGKVMVSRQTASPRSADDLVFEAPVSFLSETIGAVSIVLSPAKLNEQVAAIYKKVIVDQIAYGLTLALLIYFAASRTIVKPITRISAQMKTIIDSNFAGVPQALEVRGEDEVATLGRIFNDLNHQVYAAQQQLQQKVDLAHSSLMTTNRELHARTAELERALALVEKLALTDALTQLHNRRYFDDRIAADFHRALRFGEPLTLVLLDIDHFKQINDGLGHMAGDALLKELAGIFVRRCRDTDVVARLGGDEFAFLLYHTDLEAGGVFAEELLRIVNGHRFVVGGDRLGVGLSIGLACSSDVADVQGLYAAADAALYQAKRSGRNGFASHVARRFLPTH